MLEVYAVKIQEETINEIFNHLLELIDDKTKERVNKFRFMKDKYRTLVGEVLAKHLISKKLNLPANKIKFTYSEYNKPYLEGQTDLFFNISHSGDWVVCGISDKIIGIDVEKIEPIDYDIAKRFFSDSEHQALGQKTGKEKMEYFYTLWTLKESYIKAIGKGLYIPLSEAVFEVRKNSIKTNFDDKFSFDVYTLDPNYKLASCIIGKYERGSLTLKDIKDLINQSQIDKPNNL